MRTPTLVAFVLVSAGSFLSAQDLGRPTSATPFDNYLGVMRNTLRSLGSNDPALPAVEQYVRTGRGFRYVMKDPYVPQTPAETEATRAGDCKAKSLWLCDQLGDAHVRYVIGKTRRGAKLSHAWVMWQNQGRWWILDCTNTTRPILAESVSKNEYIPFYSYDKSGCYRHSTPQLMTASVAGKGNPVAASSHPH